MPRFTARQRAYIKKHGTPHQPSAAELDEELNIVPFLDIVINLIMFLLMSVSAVAFFAQVEASLPQYGAGSSSGARPENPLNLTVTVVAQGVIVTGSARTLGPGCETSASGRVITVPRRGDAYDWEQLTACAQKVKAEFPNENTFQILADPAIEYQHVISAMDAMRTTAAGDPLFGEARLQAGVR